MSQISNLVNQYLNSLVLERRRAAKTVEAYRRYLDRFLAWAQIDNIDQVTADLVGNFKSYLSEAQFSADQFGKQQAHLQNATQYYHLVALRSFLNYLTQKNTASLSAKDVVLGVAPKRHLDILTDEEVEKLLNSFEGDTLASRRDQAILETLFATGLRVAELCSLSRLDFNREQASLSLSRNSGATRLVYLSAPAKKALAGYLDKRPDENSALFINLGRGKAQTRATRLTSRSIQRIVKKYALLAGVEPKKVTPSALRHAFAFGLVRAGADVGQVQRLLGHSHLASTQIYTRLASN